MNILLEIEDERERDVIIKRFGLDGKGRRTLQEIAKDYNLSKDRIRIIEAKCLHKLRKPDKSERLKDFF